MSEVIVLPKTKAGDFYVILNPLAPPEDQYIISAVLALTTDGDGNVIPIPGGGGGGGSTSIKGYSSVVLTRVDYASVPVLTSAFTTLIASTSDTINSLNIFDSSGQTLVIATGAAGFEVSQMFITPGGNGNINLLIPAGSRVSIKAVSAQANVGELDITFLK